MNISIAKILAFMTLFYALQTPLARASTAEGDIRAFEQRQEAAWNAHDSKAYTDCFADNADIVNVLGWWWKSRDEAYSKLSVAFGSVFAHSNLHFDSVTVRLLTKEIAVVHVQWSMTGALSPDGSGANVPQKGIQTQVLRQESGSWHVVSFQNTNMLPERPFPVAPPANRGGA